MPWKQDIVTQKSDQIDKDLFKVVTLAGKNKVQCESFEKHTQDVQAILINPPWDCMNPLANYQETKGQTDQKK